MSEGTSEPAGSGSDEAKPAKKRAPRTSSAAKASRGAAGARTSAPRKPKASQAKASQAAGDGSAATAPIADPEPAPAAAPEAAPEASDASPGQHAHAAPAASPGAVSADAAGAPAPRRTDRSFLDSVRANAVGPLTAGLVVAILVALLLSVLVPGKPSVLAMIILGALLAAAVGFSMRYLSDAGGLRRQAEAFIAAVIGVHVMSITGLVSGDLPALELIGAEGPSFNDALLAALATPPVSTGGLLAGLSAAIIVGWGARSER
ncbi:hypothetical protein [Demequina sp. NBRC 110053]|uniref:hypothetical protein n=1 Tax=Demequina sp. NBRC 110053 TaxID=1570342 RepID=UPI000A0128AB|nr:hypothetical protein [Demequina sp. NBRC 110053]